MAGLFGDGDFMGALGAGLLAQSGPSMMPVSLGQAFGRAYQPAMDASRETQAFALKKRLMEMQEAKARQDMEEEQRQAELGRMIAGGQFQDPAALQRAVGQAFPKMYAQQALTSAFPKQGEAFTLKPGERRFDPAGKVVAEGGADVEKQPEEMRLLNAYHAMPAEDPRREMLGSLLKKKMTHAPAANQNVTIKQEGEEAKAVGKFFGESYSDIQKAGFNAQGKVNRIDRLNSLLDGVNTGKFTPLGTEVASAAASLGLKIDPKLGNKQAAQALSSEIALELRNPSGGAGMPGAMSDADRQFLAGMVPGIEKTPEGRAMISETMKKLAKRDQQVAKMAAEYRRKNKSFDEGFFQELRQFSDANPLFATRQAAPAKQGAKFLGFEGK